MTMIKAENLTKYFGKRLAVDAVSFEVNEGEVLGFLGPNGAGKSTTMRMLTGYLSPSSGRVVIDGHDMDEHELEAKSSIGYLPENAPAYADMTVRGFLEFIGRIRGLSARDCEAAVDKVVEICQLEKVEEQTIDTLSKGYKHRTCFAQAILCDPPVLVLDEPTDGLDPNQKHQMRQLIAEMGKKKAIIVSTHILEEVEAICTRVIIIDKGHIVFNGTPDELRKKSPEAGAVCVRTSVALNEIEAVAQGIVEIRNVVQKKNGFLVFYAHQQNKEALLPQVQKIFQEHHWEIQEIYTEQGRLDEVFRVITTSETAESAKEDAK